MLSSGENVEPAPIEDACAVSPFIQHLVLVGQDHRMLGALVVPATEAFAELQDIKGASLWAHCKGPCHLHMASHQLFMTFHFPLRHRTHVMLRQALNQWSHLSGAHPPASAGRMALSTYS